MQFQAYERDIVAKAKINFVPGLEWEDIAQELRIHLWKQKEKFQSEKGASERTFVIRILENKIKDLKKAAYRSKRKIDSFHFTFSQLEKTGEGLMQLSTAIQI